MQKKLVKSDQDVNTKYEVTLDDNNSPVACTCPSGQHSKPCKHLYRAQIEDDYRAKHKNLLLMGFNPKTIFEELLISVGKKKIPDGLFATNNKKNYAIYLFLQKYETFEQKFKIVSRDKFKEKVSYLIKNDIFFKNEKEVLKMYSTKVKTMGEIPALVSFLNETAIQLDK